MKTTCACMVTFAICFLLNLPALIGAGKNITFKLPATFTFSIEYKCVLIGSGHPIVWVIKNKDEEVATYIPDYVISQTAQTKTIVVTQITLAINETVRCDVIDQVELQSNYRKIITRSGPYIAYYDEFYADTVGSLAMLPCRLFGNEKGNVTWYHPLGHKVMDNERMRVLPGGDLKIGRISREDLGKFKCVISTSDGEDEIETYMKPLVVWGGPQSPLKPLELMCEISTRGHPTVRVIFNSSEEIAKYDALDLSRSLPVTETIIRTGITSAQKNNTKCQVDEEHEQKVSISRALRGPRIGYYDKRYSDYENNTAVLPCRLANNEVALDVKWLYFDGKEVKDNSRMTILSNGDLKIEQLRWNDGGVYKCVVRTANGEDEIETVVEPLE